MQLLSSFSGPKNLKTFSLYNLLFFLHLFVYTRELNINKGMRKPCCEKEGINKGAWSKQEDRILVDYISSHGDGCWRSLPEAAGLRRCGKSCRLRWINYLRPDIKRGNFAQDEEDLIIKLHALLGNRWSLIAGRLPGRTDNEVKNYWNSHLRKKLINMGIDPNNHKPHQHLHRPLPSHASHITDSSSSMENATKSLNHRVKEENDSVGKTEGDPDQVSGAPLELNLDLTIAVSPRLHLEEIKCEDSLKLDGFGSTQVEASPSTLSLFR